MSYVTRKTQNENDSINSILQHGRVADKNCWVVFPALGFPYLILCPRKYKWKVATTYLAMQCVKSVQIQSYFWSVFSCIQSEYRKIQTRYNFAFGNFSQSDKG